MFQIIKTRELASTNSYAIDLLKKGSIKMDTLIVAENQLDGRGQAENKWFSKAGDSLTFSLVVFPTNIAASRQFILSQFMCLSILHILQNYTNDVSIKWPNDIFIRGKKAGGVLIENTIMGKHIAHSVCGVGLNINNQQFPDDFVATSLSLETDKYIDLDIFLNNLIDIMSYYYVELEKENYKSLNNLYHKNLYKKGEVLYFEDSEGQFIAKIEGVDMYGRLVLRDDNGQLRTYSLKEVVLLQ